MWNVCLARGIIVDFPKTHKAIMWLRQMPMYFAYLFLFLHAFTVYLTLDPNLEKGELSDILQATLSILAVLFVLLMTKEFVVIEGANSLLTLNMVVYLFQDEHLLREKGFASSTCLDWNLLSRDDRTISDVRRLGIFLGTRFIEILKAARRRSIRFADCH